MMGSQNDISGKLNDVMKVSPSSDGNNKINVSPKEKLGNCKSNVEDDVFYMEGLKGVHDNGVGSCRSGEHLEVDIVGDTGLDEGEKRVVEIESQDTTECSSSFGCTDSGGGNADVSGDTEVASLPRYDNTMVMDFDGGFNDLCHPRKKKLPDGWRDYVRPLMWRCKWVELQIKELQTQAAKYSREVAECDKRKQCELEKISTEGYAMKSSPFTQYQNQHVKLMKRKKRRRVEETADLASYTTHHRLFSYFASKNSVADTAYVGDDNCPAGRTSFEGDEFDVDDDLPSFQFKDSDAFESILRKIEEAQVRVRQLKMRMDKVASDYSCFTPRNQATICGPSSVPPHVNRELACLGSVAATSQRSSKMLVLPETSISLAVKATPPDMIKSIDGPQTRGKCEKIENGIPISNRPVKEEFDYTEEIHTQLLAESPSKPEGKPLMVNHVLYPKLPSKREMPQEQLTVKTQSTSKPTSPKNKRKRGRRKARTGRWSKRSSG